MSALVCAEANVELAVEPIVRRTNGSDRCTVDCGAPLCARRARAKPRRLAVLSLAALLSGSESDDPRWILTMACPRCGSLNRL